MAGEKGNTGAQGTHTVGSKGAAGDVGAAGAKGDKGALSGPTPIVGAGAAGVSQFLASAAWIAPADGFVDALIVAGGGGAGGGNSGGGGAGGVVQRTIAVTAGVSYAVDVGAGGAGNIGRSTGYNGESSCFGTGMGGTCAVGGGAGSDNYSSKSGNAGGSGGGAFDVPGQGGAATPGQGYAGGVAVMGTSTGPEGGSYRMGGGGGYTQAGNQRGHGRGGHGRCFTEFSSYANGGCYGGGGAGGCHAGIPIPRSMGGGGVGGTCDQSARNGLANSGGGGGGAEYDACGTTAYGGVGGSGIVIINFRETPSTGTTSTIPGRPFEASLCDEITVSGTGGGSRTGSPVYGVYTKDPSMTSAWSGLDTSQPHYCLAADFSSCDNVFNAYAGYGWGIQTAQHHSFYTGGSNGDVIYPFTIIRDNSAVGGYGNIPSFHCSVYRGLAFA
jgi:hypothetical protein